jgi:hypothetical protein
MRAGQKPGWQNKVIAPVMWVGVRIGGVSFLPTPFRWGFGKTKKPKRNPSGRACFSDKDLTDQLPGSRRSGFSPSSCSNISRASSESYS